MSYEECTCFLVVCDDAFVLLHVLVASHTCTFPLIFQCDLKAASPPEVYFYEVLQESDIFSALWFVALGFHFILIELQKCLIQYI